MRTRRAPGLRVLEDGCARRSASADDGYVYGGERRAIRNVARRSGHVDTKARELASLDPDRALFFRQEDARHRVGPWRQSRHARVARQVRHEGPGVTVEAGHSAVLRVRLQKERGGSSRTTA